MKKQNKKSLSLSKQTIRALADVEKIAGGIFSGKPTCYSNLTCGAGCGGGASGNVVC